MLKKKVLKGNIILSIWLLSIIMIGITYSAIADEDSYQINLQRGTMTLTVSEYDKDAWEDNIDNSGPDKWFDGDADEKNAQKKITIRGIDVVEYETYDLWTLIFMEDISEDVLGLLLMNSSQFNFGEDNVNDNYDEKYDAWEALYADWDFTTESFEEEADDANNFLWILKNPKDYDEILENYNEWAEETNMKLQLTGLSVPNYTKAEFFWLLILDGLIAADPISNYLEEIIDALDLSDVELENNIIIIEDSDYSVEVSYASNGMQNGFVVKDKDDDIIYEISEDISNLIVLIVIPIVVIVSIIGIIYIAKRHKKTRN